MFVGFLENMNFTNLFQLLPNKSDFLFEEKKCELSQLCFFIFWQKYTKHQTESYKSVWQLIQNTTTMAKKLQKDLGYVAKCW